VQVIRPVGAGPRPGRGRSSPLGHSLTLLLAGHSEAMAAAARSARVASDYISSMGDWRFEPPLSPTDPAVLALRQELEEQNGLPGLELLHPTSTPNYVQRACELLRRDGFCVVRDGFLEQLPALRAASDRITAEISSKDPDGYGNRGPQRYSFGVASLTGQCLHEKEWAACVDLPAITPILQAMWPGGYKCDGGGGDFSMPQCTGYQPLHTDYRDALRMPIGGGRPIAMGAPTEPGKEYKQMGSFWDPAGRVNHRDLPTPEITLNFLVQDFTKLNGPTRQIPGTHISQALIPTPEEEPAWMRLSTVIAPAGSVLLRDPRAWHGAHLLATATATASLCPLSLRACVSCVCLVCPKPIH
jgi:hypothetical protein